MLARTLTFILTLLALPLSPFIAQAEPAPVYSCQIVIEFPHQPDTSTQGLFYLKGRLYESSGGFGESFLTVTNPASGEQDFRVNIDNKHFAEGIALYDNKVFMLTWLSGTGYIHDLTTLQPLTSFAYRLDSEKTEGWGLTFDGQNFILSSGKSELHFHRPTDFARIGNVQVTDDGVPVRLLNELEYVGGRVLANIWKSDKIAVINPLTGHVEAWIDLSTLRTRIAPESGVANGIAYDNKSGRLFVTGKHWDKVFVISLEEVLWRQPVNEEYAPVLSPDTPIVQMR